MLWAAREDRAEIKRFVNKVAITLSVFWWALAPSQRRGFPCSNKCCHLPLFPRTSPPSCWGLAALSPFLSAVSVLCLACSLLQPGEACFYRQCSEDPQGRSRLPSHTRVGASHRPRTNAWCRCRPSQMSSLNRDLQVLCEHFFMCLRFWALLFRSSHMFSKLMFSFLLHCPPTMLVKGYQTQHPTCRTLQPVTVRWGWELGIHSAGPSNPSHTRGHHVLPHVPPFVKYHKAEVLFQDLHRNLHDLPQTNEVPCLSWAAVNGPQVHFWVASCMKQTLKSQ